VNAPLDLKMTKNRSTGKSKKAPVFSINPDNPQQRLINHVSDVLGNGGLIAYPTDTFYGIGCDLYNKKGIQLIYRLKNRPLKKPFSFVCDGLKEISRYAIVSNYAYKTMRRLLPGPYTFVLEGTRLVPKIMLTKRKTVGIRVPDNKICLAIVKTFGRPIISTSASYDDPRSILEAYEPHLDVIIDGGVLFPSPSSVVSLIDDIPEVIREGKGDVSIFA
jgi:tRNA threonylcarbamoyl adenosine modification protein (Sua5/YciO/YrdC/YwlC family)